MKKFIQKFTLFIASLSILLIATDLIVVPQFAGRIFNEKYEYFSKNGQDFDLVFFGSSQTYRHFIPDSVETKLGVRSFNYGMPSFIGYSRNTLLEQLLKRDHFNNTTYLLLEMGNFMPLYNIERKILTDNGRIFFTFKSYYQHLLYYMNVNASFSFKLDAFFRLSKAYLRSRIKIPTPSYSNQILRSIMEPRVGFIAEKKGYMPFELDDPEITNRFETILTNPQVVDSIKSNTFVVRQHNSPVNKTLLGVYERWIERCKAQGIQLIWVLNPLTAQSTDPTYEIYYMKQILNKLPEEHAIDLGDPVKYPEFFDSNYVLDKAHLNHEGAKIYSAYLAKELERIINR